MDRLFGFVKLGTTDRSHPVHALVPEARDGGRRVAGDPALEVFRLGAIDADHDDRAAGVR